MTVTEEILYEIFPPDRHSEIEFCLRYVGIRNQIAALAQYPICGLERVCRYLWFARFHGDEDGWDRIAAKHDFSPALRVQNWTPEKETQRQIISQQERAVSIKVALEKAIAAQKGGLFTKAQICHWAAISQATVANYPEVNRWLSEQAAASRAKHAPPGTKLCADRVTEILQEFPDEKLLHAQIVSRIEAKFGERPQKSPLRSALDGLATIGTIKRSFVGKNWHYQLAKSESGGGVA